MIVVSDTSPLNYLILIGHVDVLPALFGRVIAPPAVMAELAQFKAPVAVKEWASAPAEWLEVKSPSVVIEDVRLGPGESEAIALAREIEADLVLLDDRAGFDAAQRLGLAVTGMLGVLELAAHRRLLDLPSAIAALRQTTFREPRAIIEEMLQRESQRRGGTR